MQDKEDIKLTAESGRITAEYLVKTAEAAVEGSRGSPAAPLASMMAPSPVCASRYLRGRRTRATCSFR
ncbi:hypothetical protein ABZY16_25265 [Streptomyces sp. NPDC006553]|uniref:hypothetical protein n=1 Tax=Streptomyces sp. NPDC006553 TaxID=3157180 RepID=UPI0033AF75A3